ncbi:MAG: DEAD/DEAH box helicase [Candidatus Sericytochromatia bacterium]|nr:DEAD/DEAH box helicase [Candidatus Sericytochromatia bacterium]
MTFKSLELPEPLLRALDKAAYPSPTPIQSLAIPLILAGHDLLAQAQTGTGKTAAFALPALQFWADANAKSGSQASHNVHTLVLTPTRELALQVASAFGSYGQFLTPKPRIHAIIGGEETETQTNALRKGADIVVATPGRLLDLYGKQEIHLHQLALLVLDEADKMLSLGFAEELEKLLQILPNKRQTLLFSATFPEKVRVLTLKVLTDPIPVRVEQAAPTLDRIQQRVIEVDTANRGRLLRHLLKTENWAQTVVFVGSKRAAANLATKLKKDGLKAVAFHGDLDQIERVAALQFFENKRAQVLIATDIASRGLDFEEISHVVNFDLPRSPADYIHRIGRTARAGKVGMAISLISAESAAHFKLIEKRAGIQLEREHIPGFEPTDSPIENEAAVPNKGPLPVKGKRKSKKDKVREARLRVAASSDGL